MGCRTASARAHHFKGEEHVAHHARGDHRRRRVRRELIELEVKRRGDVRRAKLYYLRERSGKSARIKEKLFARDKEVMAPEAPAAE